MMKVPPSLELPSIDYPLDWEKQTVWNSHIGRSLSEGSQLLAARVNGLLPANGSEPMSGDLDMAGFSIINITNFSAVTGSLSGLLTLNGGQIKFPATQVPSADANTFDDYEEGTWTPTMTFGGSATGVTYTTQIGRYTKIGRLVTIEGELLLSSNGTGVGAALILGLPFTVGISTSANIIGYTQFVVVAGMSGVFTEATSTIELRTPNTSGTTVTTDANVGNTARFFIGGSYSI